MIGPQVCATFTVRTVASEEPLATLYSPYTAPVARGRSDANAAMSDEVVNVIKETAEVVVDAVINVVEAAPEAVKEAVAAAPEVIKEATAAAPEVIRETVPEVIKETVAAAAAIEPDVVVDEATRVYNYVVTCMAYASLALAICIVIAWRLFGARVAALVAPPARPPPSTRRRLMASMGDVPPTNAQTWHAPAKEKRRTVLDARTFDKDK